MPLVVVVVQYILPGSFIIFVHFCLLKTIWIRGNRAMIKGLNTASKTKLIATRVKGMTFLILATFSFIVCYFFFLASLLYNHKAEPYHNFQTSTGIRWIAIYLLDNWTLVVVAVMFMVVLLVLVVVGLALVSQS